MSNQYNKNDFGKGNIYNILNQRIHDILAQYFMDTLSNEHNIL